MDSGTAAGSTPTRVSIRYVTALFTGAVLAISVALVLLLTLSTVLREWRADSLRRAQTTANLVALSSQQALESGDVIALDQLMREVTRDRRLERVIVSDPSGRPISDSAPGKPAPALLRQIPNLGQSSRVTRYGSYSEVLVPISRLGTPLGAVYVRFSLLQQQATERWILQRGIAIGIVALLVSAALAVGFATILTAPLLQLAHSMDRVAGGELDERVPAGNWRELHQMASSFNHMAAALGYRLHELRSLTHLSLVISRSLTPSEVMDAAVRRVHGAFPDSRVQIWLPDQCPDCLVLAADSAEAASSGTRLEVSASPLLAHAVRTRPPGSNEEPLPADPSFAARFGADAAIAVPLTTGGAEAIGALVMLGPGPERELRERMPFLTSAGYQIALALDNARLYEAERRARGEAEEANQAKDQFVALVSHELRNPLNAIASGLHLLRASCPAGGRVGMALEIVERNTALQTRLVNDLLDLSRLQRGKLQLQRTPVELEKAVTAACQSYEAQAREAGLKLACRCEPGLWVHGDADRLQQVVLNFLSNAVKFTPAGGAIRVTTSQRDGRAWIEVADTGIGLDRVTLEHLFEMFRQGEVAGVRRPGLGIGLALVRGIVERHGGRVWAESEGPGKGSRFIVELPLSEAPRIAGAEGAAPAEGQARVRVLLIEDNADARMMVADSLTLDDFDVYTAGSGEEGLEVLQDVRPDMMLIDIGLPGMDGFEFLRRARERDGMADVPAFAVTGWGEEEQVRRGREVGFAGHFVKPVDVSALTETIREWVGRRPGDNPAH